MIDMDAATLPRHELAGLTVRVAAASNPDLVGIAGEVLDESTNTLLVRVESGSASGAGGAVKRVPKAAATFEFRLPERGDAAGATPTHVTVEGERLVARPARRTETTGDNTWR